MTQKPRGAERRPAFTLIEILVVIAIIAVLVSLTAAAVMKAYAKGPEMQTAADLRDLDSQLSKQKSALGLPYWPSRLHLSKKNNYGNTPLDRDSVAFLQDRFTRDGCYRFQAPPAGQFIDWNGDGNPNEELYLEGEQCLVFHLGGVPVRVNGQIKMVGFSQNKTNPALPPQAQGERRDGPFFEFKTERLKDYTSTLPNNSGVFPVFLDPWGGKTPQPYAFLSGYGTENGNCLKYGGSDCPGLGLNPYFSTNSPTTLFVNGNTWQIVSAGADNTFGPGGQWTPTSTVSGAGMDDQSNFSPRKLGAN